MFQGGLPESLPAPAAPPELTIPEANSSLAGVGSAMKPAPCSDGGLDDELPSFASGPKQQSDGMEAFVAIDGSEPAVPQLPSTTLLDEAQPPQSDPPQVSQNLDLMALLPRASAGAKLKHLQAWLAFASKHRHILDTRVKAEGVRKTFNDKEAGLREANAIFTRLLRDFQAVPSDPKVRDRLLKQSYAINTAQDQLQAAGDELRGIDANLVKEEWELLNLLPEILQRDAEPEDLSSILRQKHLTGCLRLRRILKHS
jgi:hypothetical protein